MELKERIKEIRNSLNIGTQSDLATIMKVNQDRVKSLETGRVKEISAIEANELVKNFNLSLDWLLTGRGSMISNFDSHDGFAIDVLNLKASAGSGIIPYEVDVIDKYIIDKSFFKTTPQLDKIKIIQVEGDSMEPTIQDGAYIVIDETKQERIDGIYACLIDDSVFVKRLQFDFDGNIKIISDNEKYEPKYYNSKNSQIYFKILGRKILTIQK